VSVPVHYEQSGHTAVMLTLCTGSTWCTGCWTIAAITESSTTMSVSSIVHINPICASREVGIMGREARQRECVGDGAGAGVTRRPPFQLNMGTFE